MTDGATCCHLDASILGVDSAIDRGVVLERFSEDFKRGGSEILQTCCAGIEAFHRGMEDNQISFAEISLPDFDFSPRAEKHPYEILGQFFKFIHVSYVEKFRDLVGGFICSINDRQYLLAALCGRSLIESTATLRYYNAAVMKKARVSAEREISGLDIDFLQDAFRLAEQHMKGSRLNWVDFFTSDKRNFIHDLVEREKRRLAKEKPRKEEYLTSPPIGKFMDSWFDDEPELVALSYNFFSELVHPNLGSNLLLTGVSEGKVQVGRNSNRAAGKAICREAVLFIAPCLKESARQLGQSVLISSLGDKVIPKPPRQ